MSEPLSATWEQILHACSKHGSVPLVELRTRKRGSSRVTRVRHVAMYLGRSLAGLTLQEIGSRLGGRDHTTVIHGVARVERDLRSGREGAPKTFALVKKVKAALSSVGIVPGVSMSVGGDPVTGVPKIEVVYTDPGGSRWRASIEMKPVE